MGDKVIIKNVEDGIVFAEPFIPHPSPIGHIYYYPEIPKPGEVFITTTPKGGELWGEYFVTGVDLDDDTIWFYDPEKGRIEHNTRAWFALRQPFEKTELPELPTIDRIPLGSTCDHLDGTTRVFQASQNPNVKFGFWSGKFSRFLDTRTYKPAVSLIDFKLEQRMAYEIADGRVAVLYNLKDYHHATGQHFGSPVYNLVRPIAKLDLVAQISVGILENGQMIDEKGNLWTKETPKPI